MTGRVERISVAPVKALGLNHPDSIELDTDGAIGDRRFWLVDDELRLYNNKRCGPLVRVKANWDEAANTLTLTFPDGAAVSGTVELGAEIVPTLYRIPWPSRVVEGPFAEALSAFAGTEIRLLLPERRANDRLHGGGGVSFVSRASLDRLGQELGATIPLDGRRFRMLFELDGLDANEEDTWLGREIAIGDAVVRVNGDVGRCAVTTHDPDTGVPSLDTLRALRAYRPEGQTEPLPLGVYAEVVRPGTVRLGDSVSPLG